MGAFHVKKRSINDLKHMPFAENPKIVPKTLLIHCIIGWEKVLMCGVKNRI